MGGSFWPTFADVPWSGGGTKTYQVFVDITGGTNYAFLGSGQFKSVPFAMHALTSGSAAGWSLWQQPAEYQQRQHRHRQDWYLERAVTFYSNGVLEASSETDLRLSVYQSMQWDLFDRVFYYDEGKADTVKYLGWNLSGGFFPLPINTEYFRPSLKPRPIDVCFIGKPTPRRIQILDFLRSANLNFVWIAHGVHGRQLANVLRRSKVVLNIHADDLPAIEPRIFLAASCGCAVVSDALPKSPAYFSDQVFETRDSLSLDYVRYALDQFEQNREKWNRHSENPLGTRRFIRECFQISLQLLQFGLS